MSHGDHGGHDMPMPAVPKCSMHMLWNTDIVDTCIVFRSWHISTTTGFVLSCVAIVSMGIFYEWLREAQKNLDKRIAAQLSAQGKGKARVVSAAHAEDGEEEGLLTGVRGLKGPNETLLPTSARLSRALLYGATVFLSFFLMLVFMTYNAYLIGAVVVGAALGHFIFSPAMDIDAVISGGSTAGKGMACH